MYTGYSLVVKPTVKSEMMTIILHTSQMRQQCCSQMSCLKVQEKSLRALFLLSAWSFETGLNNGFSRKRQKKYIPVCHHYGGDIWICVFSRRLPRDRGLKEEKRNILKRLFNPVWHLECGRGSPHDHLWVSFWRSDNMKTRPKRTRRTTELVQDKHSNT